jgi:16S rRNA (guanine(527)-N(7))-methyltransferase RsmG
MVRFHSSAPNLFQMNNEFTEAIKTHQKAFGLNLSDEKINELNRYYELVQKNNELLHLVAPCSAEEFAVRHILESLTALEFLPKDIDFADIGTGAGLPSIPCLIVREDLRGVLIESKAKKVGFLHEVLAICELEDRAYVINRQFEEIPKPNVSYILCRALDKFTQKLPKILRWSQDCNFLFFAGNAIREELEYLRVLFNEKLMPLSEQRFLFTSKKDKT